MRRLKVRFRPQAVADIENVYRYLLRAGATRVTAQRFVTRMRDRCLRIGNVPLGGRARDDLERGLRTVPFEHSAVIAYKVEGRSGSPTSSTVAATMRPCSGATTRPLRAGMNNQSQGPSRPHIFHDSGLGKRFPNL
jgi:toxin ParE1/3/4